MWSMFLFQEPPFLLINTLSNWLDRLNWDHSCLWFSFGFPKALRRMLGWMQSLNDQCKMSSYTKFSFIVGFCNVHMTCLKLNNWTICFILFLIHCSKNLHTLTWWAETIIWNLEWKPSTELLVLSKPWIVFSDTLQIGCTNWDDTALSLL